MIFLNTFNPKSIKKISGGAARTGDMAVKLLRPNKFGPFPNSEEGEQAGATSDLDNKLSKMTDSSKPNKNKMGRFSPKPMNEFSIPVIGRGSTENYRNSQRQNKNCNLSPENKFDEEATSLEKPASERYKVFLQRSEESCKQQIHEDGLSSDNDVADKGEEKWNEDNLELVGDKLEDTESSEEEFESYISESNDSEDEASNVRKQVGIEDVRSLFDAPDQVSVLPFETKGYAFPDSSNLNLGLHSSPLHSPKSYTN